MSVAAFDSDEALLEDPLQEGSVIPYNWPDVHVGHSIVAWKDKFVVFGGFFNVYGRQTSEGYLETSRYHSTRHIWMYSTDSDEWNLEETYGESPPRLSSAACAIVNDCLFIFCGYSRTNFYNDSVYRLDLLTKIWTKVFPKSDREIEPISEPHPAGRDKLSSFDYDGCIYLFGGYGSVPLSQYELYDGMFFDADRELFPDRKVWHNSLIRFDVASNGFSLVKTNGAIPSPRAACSTCKLGDRFYVFGGRLASVRMDDMFYLDLESMAWTQVKQSSPLWPKGRSWGVLSPIGGGSKLLLQGGLDSDGHTLNGFWLFDISSQTWSLLQPFSARIFWHAGTSTGDSSSVYLFGGFKHAKLQSHHRDNEISSSELIVVSLSPPSLKCLALQKLAERIVSSRDDYENDTFWAVLNQFLQPRDVNSVQRCAKRMKYIKFHQCKRPSSAVIDRTDTADL